MKIATNFFVFACLTAASSCAASGQADPKSCPLHAEHMAQAAALMTDTTFTSRVLGSAWPGHFNIPIGEDMYENINRVGLPQWSEADQTLADRPSEDRLAGDVVGKEQHYGPPSSGPDAEFVGAVLRGRVRASRKEGDEQGEDEAVEIEATREVEVDQDGEVPGGQAVAVPGGLEDTAPAEHLDEG